MLRCGTSLRGAQAAPPGQRRAARRRPRALDADPLAGLAAARLTRFVYDARLGRLVEQPEAPPVRAPREGRAAPLARAAEPLLRLRAAAFEVCEEGQTAAGWDDSDELFKSLVGEPHLRTAVIVMAALFLWHHGAVLAVAFVETAALLVANGLAARRARGDAAGAPPAAAAALAALLALLAAAALAAAPASARSRFGASGARPGRRRPRASGPPRAPRSSWTSPRACSSRGGKLAALTTARDYGAAAAEAAGGVWRAVLPAPPTLRFLGAAGGAGAGLPHGVAYFVCAVYSFGKFATLVAPPRGARRRRAARRRRRRRRARDARAARRGGRKVPDLPRVSLSRGAHALGCNHVFCGAWTERSASCPVCRARIAVP